MPTPSTPDAVRAFPRLAAPFGVTWTARGLARTGVTSDISVGGCFIRSREPLHPGQVLVLAIRFRGGQVEVSGEVVWCDPAQGFGVRFLALTAAATAALVQHLRAAGLDDPLGTTRSG